MFTNGVNSDFFTALFDFKISLPEAWINKDAKLVITAVVFAGLGGLWNVLYSVWLRQEGMGAAYKNRSEFLEYKNHLFEVSQSSESIGNYQKTMKVLKRDLWFGLGGNAIMIIMIVYIAYASFPKGVEAPSGLGVITSLGDAVSYKSLFMASIFYVFIGLFLMDTWVTAADSLSKLHANMLIGLLKTNKESTTIEPESKAKLFYIGFLIIMLIMTFVSSFIARPQQLNYLNGLLSMFGSVLLIIGIFMIEIYYRKILVKFPTHPVMTIFLVVSFLTYTVLGIAFILL